MEGLTVTEKFFTSHRSSNAAEQSLISFLQRKNAKQPFVEGTVKKIGFPIWDKLMTSKGSGNKIVVAGMGEGRKQGLTSSILYNIYYIPFVRDSQNHVNAAMIIKAAPGDTSINYACDWQYKNLLASAADTQNHKVKEFALFFMRFDYSVFGHKGFVITDKTIFATKDHASADEVRLELKNEGQKTVKANSMYVTCQDYVIEFISCPYIRRDGACTGPGGTCDRCSSCPSVTINYTECWDEWIDDEPPGGGSSGDGSSGGGGAVPPSDPCGGGDTPPTADAVNQGGKARIGAFSPPPTEPCNEPGWEPDPGPYTIPDEYGFYYDRILELQHVIDGNENGVIPCNALLLFKQFSQQFFNDLTVFSAPQAVKDRIQNIINTNSNFTSNNFFLQTLDDAKGAVVNCDFFPVNITNMPTINGQQQTPEQFLEYFRLHMNDFVTPGGIVSFTPYIGQGIDETSRWNQAGANSLGTLVHIPLVSVNDGTVIESGYSISGPPPNHSYTFSTMHSPLDAYHPVSGNRRFGIYQDQAGTKVFYIAGVDRISTNSIALGNFLGSIFQMDGFKEADKLWRDIQTNMVNFINTHGGTAAKFSGLPDFTARPKWSDVEQFLKKQIDFAELKRRLGC